MGQGLLRRGKNDFLAFSGSLESNYHKYSKHVGYSPKEMACTKGTAV